MKKIVAVIILLSFILPFPAHAEMEKEPDPVEPELLSPYKMDSTSGDVQRLNDSFQKDVVKQPVKNKTGSSWWKWALGIVVVGGIAASAGGGGGDSGGSTGTGTISGTW